MDSIPEDVQRQLEQFIEEDLAELTAPPWRPDPRPARDHD